MADFSDFLPIRRESLATIRPRIDADANAGVDPASDGFIDTTTGGFFSDVAQALALEQERLWDFAATEVPAVAFITFAWGQYLDYHGVVLGVPRKAAARASGTLRFIGTNGATIGTGFQVATLPTDPDADPIAFKTTASGTIAGGILDLPGEALELGAAGNVPVASLTEAQSALPSGVTSVTNLAPMAGGAEPESDQDYRERLLLEFASVNGSGTISDHQRWALAYPGVGRVTVEPVWAGDGTVRVILLDATNNPVGPATVSGYQALVDPFHFTTTTTGSQTLPLATINVTSTTGAANSGRIYINGQAISYTGKTGATFTGCTGGTGTVTAGTAVNQGGQGRGLAPIGAEVLVATASALVVPTGATITFRQGYSLDGTNGTIATRQAIIDSLASYVNALPPGEDITLDHVKARYYQVPGVWDTSGVTINAAAANLAVTTLQVPVLGSVTLADSGGSPT